MFYLNFISHKYCNAPLCSSVLRELFPLPLPTSSVQTITEASVSSEVIHGFVTCVEHGLTNDHDVCCLFVDDGVEALSLACSIAAAGVDGCYY